MPEDRSQPDIGLGGHLLGAGRYLTVADNFHHGRHDPRTVVPAAPTTTIEGFGGQGLRGRIHDLMSPETPRTVEGLSRLDGGI